MSRKFISMILLILLVISLLLVMIAGCGSQLAPTTPAATTQPTSVPPVASSNISNAAAPVTTSAESIVVTSPGNIYDGEWQSIEKASDFGGIPEMPKVRDGEQVVVKKTGNVVEYQSDNIDAILRFTVKEGRVVDLVTDIAPIKYELFAWWILAPVQIGADGFQCSQSSRDTGEFTLKGKFTSADKCEGVMKWPKGYFWVDFTMPRDVIVQWTAAKK